MIIWVHVFCFLERFCQYHSRLIVVGDFNAPDVNWSTLTASSHSSKYLCDVVSRLNLIQLITVPTHIHGNMLDLLFTNIDDCVQNISVTTNTILQSDHFIILFEVICSTRPHRQTVRYVYDYSEANFEGLNNYLLNVDFSSCYACSDVDDIWKHLKSIIFTASSFYIPKVKLRSFQYPKWFTPIIRHRLHCLHSLRRKTRKSLLLIMLRD